MKVRPAQATLTEIRNGNLLNELACAFHNAIANVREYGKPVEIIVKIKVGTMDASKHNLVEPPILMQGKVIEKMYEPEPEATLFFVDDEGNPSRTQQRQPDLLVEVGAKPGEAKS